MYRFGGSQHHGQRVMRTIVWAALACVVAGGSAPAGDSTKTSDRLAHTVKVRRQLRAAERAAMVPRKPATVAAAPRPATQPTLVAAAQPATTDGMKKSESSSRLFDANDASKVEGAANVRATATTCVVTGRALLGEPQLARFAQRIGEVDVERCFQAIPAWKTIKQEELRPTRARYHFLMRQANVDLQRAIAAAAARRGVTLVVERGGIQNAGDKTLDLTQSVLDALQSAP